MSLPFYDFAEQQRAAFCAARVALSATVATVQRGNWGVCAPPRQGTCSNRLTIRRDEVERRVLRALQEKLLRQDLFEEFCEEFTREMNRLRMEYCASLSSAGRELERVRAGIRKGIDTSKDGFAGPELRAEMNDLQARKESLAAQLAAKDAPIPLLHPNLAAMLSAAQNAKRSLEGDLLLKIALVAGACNRRHLQLWSGTA